MIMPVQANHVNRTVFTRDGVYSTNLVFPSGSFLRRQIGSGFQDDARCYYRCIANGGHDLICRFFCGLRPFTIGGLLIAD